MENAELMPLHQLHWTSEPPAVPGWYWRRSRQPWDDERGSGEPYQVTDPGATRWPAWRAFFQWAGPLPEPNE